MNTDTAEIPEDDLDEEDEPSPEEWAEIKQATAADAAAVDVLILGHCTLQWRKVAIVVGESLDDFEARLSHLPFIYLQVRLRALVEQGLIEGQGNPLSMRTFEVRRTGGSP